MAQAIIKNISTFDATKDQLIEFSYETAHRITEVIATITDNDSNISENITIETSKRSFTLPANTLTNGKFYSIRIVVVDKSGEKSLQSNVQRFYCFDTPRLYFSTLKDSYSSSRIPVEVIYDASEAAPNIDKIQTYCIDIYDVSENLLYTSGNKVATSNYLTYTFEYVENNSYYMKASVYTAKDMYVETEYVPFSVDIYKSDVFQLLDTQNNINGTISVTSNISHIFGVLYGDATFSGDKVELPQGSRIEFPQGYSIYDDFSLLIQCESLLPCSTILELQYTEKDLKGNSVLISSIKLNYISHRVYSNDNKNSFKVDGFHFELIVRNHKWNPLNYVINSPMYQLDEAVDEQDYSNDFKHKIRITKIDDVYSLDVVSTKKEE